jgi:hypothetical protein
VVNLAEDEGQQDNWFSKGLITEGQCSVVQCRVFPIKWSSQQRAIYVNSVHFILMHQGWFAFASGKWQFCQWIPTILFDRAAISNDYQ